MTNRLAGETSPYLLQHAENPVEWYPWSDEALSRARAEDKPVLLSIGYSACHWCHVMAHESFENQETAGLMNEHFINIKVDREERPDLDTIYMQAVQAITGRGGWPLTVFLTPDAKPFFGGTYFPPEDRFGMAGFPRVLQAMADAYRNRRPEIDKATEELFTALSRGKTTPSTAELLTADILQEAYLTLQQSFDTKNGGFDGPPKFPQPMALEFLLRHFDRTRDGSALDMVDTTLEKMAKGGIYDQIGGGFHRYSTDDYWLVPHFEKMLYDNAQLSQAYLHAYLVSGKPLFRTIAEETLDYVLREMTDASGGFYSTQDADSEGVEGKYFVWTPREIAEVLGDNTGETVYRRFGVTDKGNFDHGNILYVADVQASITRETKSSLLKKREQRIKPGLDEKVLAAWNGLMLTSIAEAACILKRRDYLDAAIANGKFLLDSMIADGYLKHTCKNGIAKIDGYLEDYAMVIDGFLTLHQATFTGEWLRQAIRLAEIMIEQFWDETQVTFYDSSLHHQDLFIRPQSSFDGALPSGASAATLVLLKLARLTDNERFQQVAAQALSSMRELMPHSPLGFGNWLCALDLYLSTPKEVAIIGPRDNPAAAELLHTLCATFLPNKVVAAYDPTDPTAMSDLALLENRPMVNDLPTVYICQQFTCQAPVTDPTALTAQLQGE